MKIINYIFIALAAIATLIVLAFVARDYLINNEYILSARSASPLGRFHTYIITGNLETIDGNDGSVIPANTYYTFYPVGEEKSRGTEKTFDKLIGRKISNLTTIDISQYLNQPVHIWGKFEYSLPIFINATNSSDLLSPNVALTITKIELAE